MKRYRSAERWPFRRQEKNVTEINTETEAPVDVFAAARWLDDLWNSSARAISPDEVEWMCGTWGSGRGRGYWTETATFTVVAQVFGLRTGRNHEGRDEAIVWVPLERFSEVAELIERLGEDPEEWPWFDEEAERREVEVAAEVLGLSPAVLAEDADLLEVLRIE